MASGNFKRNVPSSKSNQHQGPFILPPTPVPVPVLMAAVHPFLVSIYRKSCYSIGNC
jgi:hypothetical protein